MHVLPDDAFAHDGQITKQTIRAVTLAALAPRPGELLWDVGAGRAASRSSGAVADPAVTAVAFERDEQRRRRIAANAVAHGVSVDVRGSARRLRCGVLSSGGVDGVSRPDVIFIGGGLTEPGLLQTCYERLPAGGRLIANAVTVESESVVAQWYSNIGGLLRRYQHYLGEPLGGFTGWRPAMPVTQWSVVKP